MRYGVALVLVGVAVALRIFLDPVMGKQSFLVFVAAVLVGGWIGGIGPAVVCLVSLHVIHGYWFQTPHGLWEHNMASAVTTSAYYVFGIAVGVLSQLRASAQRRAQDQQREAVSQREHLLTTISCMAEGVLLTDVHGDVKLMNRAAEAMTGWNLHDSKGAPLWEIFSLHREDEQPSIESPIDRALRENHVVQEGMPLVLTSRVGHKIPITYSAAPVQDNEGRTTGVVLVFRDESQRQRTELALRNADRRKDEFLATLAHELRNP
jgi:PAS domain S-box-containing protein